MTYEDAMKLKHTAPATGSTLKMTLSRQRTEPSVPKDFPEDAYRDIQSNTRTRHSTKQRNRSGEKR